MTHGDIDLFLFPDGQHIFVVLQQDQALSLAILTQCHVFLATECLSGLFLGDIGILKETQLKGQDHNTLYLFPENAQHVFFAVFFHAQTVAFQQTLIVITAAVLVNAGLKGLQVTCRGGVMLTAPAAAAAKSSDGTGDGNTAGAVKGFTHNAEIRSDHALVAKSVTEQIGENVFAVAVAHVLTIDIIGTVGNGVVRHQAGSLLGGAVQLEGALGKGGHMFFKVSAGIDGIFTLLIVGIAAAFAAAAAGPVFGGACHAFIAPAIPDLRVTGGGLNGVHIAPCHIHAQLAAFTVGTVTAAPTGLCGQVDLRCQRQSHTHGAVLLGLNTGQSAGILGIKGCANTQRAGEITAVLGQATLTSAYNMAYTLHGIHHGNAVGQGLADFLLIVDIGQDLVQIFHKHIKDLITAHGAVGIICQSFQVFGGHFPADTAQATAQEAGGHQLLRRKAANQILDALLGAQAPVLIGLKLACFTQVLKGEAVYLQNFDAACIGPAQYGAVFIFCVPDCHIMSSFFIGRRQNCRLHNVFHAFAIHRAVKILLPSHCMFIISLP